MSEQVKLETPKAIRLISIATMILGLVTIITGILDFANILTLRENFVTLLQDEMIFFATMVILGIAILVIGYGLLKTLNYAFFAFLIVYVLVMGILFFMFPDYTGTKILLAVVSFILGDFLAEHEYFNLRGKGRRNWENPPTMFKLISLAELILGIATLIIGVLLYMDIAVPFFDIASWIENSAAIPFLGDNPQTYGIILFLLGIILLIAAYTLFKTIFFAIYVYVIAFFVTIGFILLSTPPTIEFLIPTVLIIFASILAGDIVAENEVFFD